MKLHRHLALCTILLFTTYSSSQASVSISLTGYDVVDSSPVSLLYEYSTDIYNPAGSTAQMSLSRKWSVLQA